MLKIFLAEDEVIVRETIKRMIPWEDLGFELVGEAADGEMALPLLLRQKPDLLITDIKMPFMDGLTLAKVAKKEIPGLKVVILSGYDDFNYAKQAINIGVEDYLLKPLAPEDVSGLLDKIEKELKVPYLLAPSHLNRQRAGAVAALGMQYAQAGHLETAMEHQPNYLRLSQAERERAEKQAGEKHA